jgi:CRISPR system Cascade subunit CasA
LNLLTDNWLPFRKRDGNIVYGPLASIEDPDILDLALPRADFQGAAYQWLIGLLQTAIPPDGYAQWMARLERGPDAGELATALFALGPAFELDGDGPRFMQDLDPLDDAKPAPVAGLLIDAPGANGIKNNTDLFIKRGFTEALCPDCAAIALFTMQINAPSGGVGYRVGLRGGGPLTTLILPESENASLWQRLWLNVLPVAHFRKDGESYPSPVADDAALFAWMGPTRESKEKGSAILPDDVHSLHAYWAMPRRFRLLFTDTACQCDLCGRESATGVREVLAKNYGANYEGPWLHPLTPYRIDAKKPEEPPLSSKGQPGGLGYPQWSPLVLPDPDDSGARPADVVDDFIHGKCAANWSAREWGDDLELLLKHPRLWAFGYDMDNMKPRCWYSVEMPLIVVPSEAQERFRAWVQSCTALARQVAWVTRTQIKAAWFKRPKDARGDLSTLDLAFYEATERDFFAVLSRLRQSLQEDDIGKMPPAIAEKWYRDLRSAALRQFEAQALSAPAGQLNLQRIVAARGQLLAWLAGRGKGAKLINEFARNNDFELGKAPAAARNQEEKA